MNSREMADFEKIEVLHAKFTSLMKVCQHLEALSYSASLYKLDSKKIQDLVDHLREHTAQTTQEILELRTKLRINKARMLG